MTAQQYERVLKILRVHGYVPHAKAMELMCNADVLILALNKSHASNARGLIPGKIFEYMATGNTVLVTGDQDSDVGRIVKEYGNGFVVNDGDVDTLTKQLASIVEKGMHGSLKSGPSASSDIFERRNLTATLSNLMQELLKE